MKEANESGKTQSSDQAKDPICGMIVTKATSLHTEQDGKTFYFCGSKCQQTFISASTDLKSEHKGSGCCG